MKEYGIRDHYKYYNDNLDKNIIIINMNIEKEDINKKIYFLDNYNNAHNNLKELNVLNTELYINNKKYEYEKYFIPEKEGEYDIHIRFKNNLTDSSYMLAGCDKIIDINFISFNTKNIVSMKNMFNGCKNLKQINLFSWDTKNVTNMSGIFSNCSSLNNLPDIS